MIASLKTTHFLKPLEYGSYKPISHSCWLLSLLSHMALSMSNTTQIPDHAGTRKRSDTGFQRPNSIHALASTGSNHANQ